MNDIEFWIIVYLIFMTNVSIWIIFKKIEKRDIFFVRLNTNINDSTKELKEEIKLLNRKLTIILEELGYSVSQDENSYY